MAEHEPVHAQVAKKANGTIRAQPMNIYIYIHIERLVITPFLYILYENDTDVITRKEKKKLSLTLWRYIDQVFCL